MVVRRKTAFHSSNRQNVGPLPQSKKQQQTTQDIGRSLNFNAIAIGS
jgi:hypothetical protein